MIAAVLTKINGHFVRDQAWTNDRLTRAGRRVRRFRPMYETPDIGALDRPRTRSDEPATAQEGTMCFHCGEPNPEPGRWRAVCRGTPRDFCCAGCLGVAQAIHVAGLDAFYERRTDVSVPRVDETGAADGWLRYDDPVLQSAFVRATPDGKRDVSLLLEGIHCGACVWLIERWLAQRPGISVAEVNFATRRAHVRCDPAAMRLSDVLRAIAAIGYRAYPYDPARREALTAARIARAAAARGDRGARDDAGDDVRGAGVRHRRRHRAGTPALLDWASLTLTLPALLYCAARSSAARGATCAWRALGMDVPVALASRAAFAASAWATFARRRRRSTTTR